MSHFGFFFIPTLLTLLLSSSIGYAEEWYERLESTTIGVDYAPPNVNRNVPPEYETTSKARTIRIGEMAHNLQKEMRHQQTQFRERAMTKAAYGRIKTGLESHGRNDKEPHGRGANPGSEANPSGRASTPS